MSTKGKLTTFINKISEEKKDSFWYDGIIAIYHLNDDTERKIEVRATGEIRVTFEPDGVTYKNHKAVEEAEYLNLTDEDLNKLNEHDGWGNNNWFEGILLDKNNKVIADNLFVEFDYDEAISTIYDVEL